MKLAKYLMLLMSGVYVAGAVLAVARDLPWQAPVGLLIVSMVAVFLALVAHLIERGQRDSG